MNTPTVTDLLTYHLSAAEVDEISEVTRGFGRSASPREARFYDEHWDLHRLLPSGLREFLDEFRRRERSDACLVRGYPVDGAAVGPTPTHWKAADGTTDEYDLYLAMCGLALGDPFSWLTLQAGAMITSILPIPGDEHRQSGHGSEALLEFHTEDGFHPARCDYLLLFGIRNDDAVPTYVASVRDVKLTEKDRRILSEPRFTIVPDDEHIRQLEEQDPGHAALARVYEMRDRPEPVPVLYGDPAAPYLRIDRPFMRCVGDDPEAQSALDALMAGLEEVKRAAVVESGDLLIVDNYLAVHGRKAFTCRYDGTDRWLKRMLVSRDLRRSVAQCETRERRTLI